MSGIIRRMRPFRFPALICLLLLCLSGSGLLGTTVKLKDGTYRNGEIISSDADGFTLHEWSTGGKIRIGWDALSPGEAARLQDLVKPPEEKGEPMLDGLLITMDDGKTYEGPLIQEMPEKYVIQLATSQRHVPRNRVAKTEPVKIRALSIYTAKEFYDLRLKALDATNAQQQYDLAVVCMQIGMYEEAKEHISKAAELDSTFGEAAQKRIPVIEKLAAESKAAALYIDAERELTQRKFSAAKELVQQLIDSYPATDAGRRGPAMLQKIDEDEKSYLADRIKYVDTKVVPAYYTALTASVQKLAGDKKATLAETMTYVESGLHQEVLDSLAGKFSIDATEVEKIWSARQGTDTRTATYGDGSFLVEQLDNQAAANEFRMLPPDKRGKLIAELAQRGSADMTAAGEDWWKKASGQRRVSWLEAYAAEKVVGNAQVKYVPCIGCSGKRYTMKNELCKRCMALGKDRVVEYK